MVECPDHVSTEIAVFLASQPGIVSGDVPKEITQKEDFRARARAINSLAGRRIRIPQSGNRVDASCYFQLSEANGNTSVLEKAKSKDPDK